MATTHGRQPSQNPRGTMKDTDSKMMKDTGKMKKESEKDDKRKSATKKDKDNRMN